MTELDKSLRSWVEAVPPVTPDEVIAASRSGAVTGGSDRPDRSWTRPALIACGVIIMIGLAVVVIPSRRDPEREPVLTGPTSTTTSGSTSPEPLSVSLVRADTGPLTVQLGEPQETAADGAWMQHEVTFVNDGTKEVYLADTRVAEVIGNAARPLLVGGDGCAFGVHPEEGTVVPFCNTDLRGYAIGPGQAETLLLRIWRDLPGAGASLGEYEFTQPIAFTDDPDLFRRPPDDPRLTHGSLVLKYYVAAAPDK